MGSGIAHIAALAGFDVTITDLSPEILEKCRTTIDTNLSRQVSKGTHTEDDKKATLARIHMDTTMTVHANQDLVIEAATEEEKIKLKIFKDLIPHLGPNTILASNTSSLSITQLASVTDRPHKFIGMHFFNPVPVMKPVELIRGMATDNETYKTISDLAIKMDKVPIVSQDFPGFIVNRILLPMINEAIYVLMEGVADIQEIDQGMKQGCGHPMGPFQLADFIGLDTCLAIMKILHEGFGDTKYRPCPLLVKYVEAGWYGKKTGRGFYDYSDKKPIPTR
jgi:3-hydroxybutyryl-CoA dehydrogenase